VSHLDLTHVDYATGEKWFAGDKPIGAGLAPDNCQARDELWYGCDMGAPLGALAPMIIGVLNRKGGVGKTTIAINVAATLAVAGVRVVLVDADPQASALSWSSLRERDPLFAVVGMARPTLHRELPGIAAKFDCDYRRRTRRQ
jgi:AAA domain